MGAEGPQSTAWGQLLWGTDPEVVPQPHWGAQGLVGRFCSSVAALKCIGSSGVGWNGH